MFSVLSVSLFTGWRGPDLTTTQFAIGKSQATCPPSRSVQTCSDPPPATPFTHMGTHAGPSNLFKLVYYVAHTFFGMQVVGLRQKELLAIRMDEGTNLFSIEDFGDCFCQKSFTAAGWPMK